MRILKSIKFPNLDEPYIIPSLPTPSIADSGKALTVQPDGSWGLSPASGAMTIVDDGEGNLTFLNVSVSTQEV